MVRIIAVASGKGGVGKTTVVANLGIAIAEQGKRVVMVDADLDMANLELALGMEGRPITLQDVLSGNAEIQDAVYDVTENAKFVPAGIAPSSNKRADPEKLSRTIEKLTPFGEYILLDCPAGIGKDTIACFAACKQTLLILTPEPMSATDAYKTRMAAEKMGSEIIGIVLNMVRNTKKEMTDKEIASLLENKILVHIPYDTQLHQATVSGKPLVNNDAGSQTAALFRQLASQITGDTALQQAPKKSFFSRLAFWRKK